MKALYTETFEDFLLRNENSDIWQGIKLSFADIPNFSLDGLNLNMYDLFKKQYLLREIGCEDEQLFTHFISVELNKIKIEFIPKINSYLENYNKLMSRVVTINEEYNNVNYLYPTLSNQGQGKVSDKSEVTNTKDKLYSIAGKSNPDLLQAILDLENIYLTALDRFEKCFMGIY